jgi:iron(III) transport system substrate-binding protein
MTSHGARSVLTAVCCLLAMACGSRADSGAPAPAAPTSAPHAQPTTSDTAPSPQLQELIEGARREGTLSLVWGDGTVGGTEATPRLAQGFNKRYGLNVDVRFTPGPSMPTMASRMSEEYLAGRPAASDLFAGFGGWVATRISADALVPVDWASWADNVQDPRVIAAGGRAVPVQSSVQGITYNTNRVRPDDVPHSLQDLLQPQYKGRIASTPYASGFDRLPVPELWGEQRTLDFMARFADQLAGLMRCSETERIASGEFEIFALDCTQSNALSVAAKGAPLGFTLATDAPFIQPLYLAVPRNAPHPNAAKLWVDYMLSREAQDLLYELDSADLAPLPGSKTAADIVRFSGANVTPIEIGVDFYEKHDEKSLDKTRQEIQRILAKQ